LFPADDRIVNQMDEKSKKYLITIESHEVFILRRNKTFRGYCARCETEVEMLKLDAITSEMKTTTRELFRLIEKNLVHSTESESGHLLVCRNSLEIERGLKFES
jgi:hypothetical protein